MIEPECMIAGVLIGGQSRRMGKPKALLRYSDVTFVERVVSAARSVADEVVLLGNTDIEVPALGQMMRLDDPPNGGGPVAGLVSLLEYAGQRWALLIACDMPLVEPKVLHRLVHACDDETDGAAFRVADQDGFRTPCCVAVHPRSIVHARAELAGKASLHGLLAHIRCRFLHPNSWETRCLRSFNTPHEYAELVARKSNWPVPGWQDASGTPPPRGFEPLSPA